jgi:hypothetical protein
MSDRICDRRGGTGLVLPAPQAADLTRMLATIDKFLRNDYADEAPHLFLDQPGTQNPGYHASILIDEVSFTELRFRQLLADGETPQPSGPRPSDGA